MSRAAADQPIPGLFAFHDDEARRLAEQHGTPLFAYHAPTARRCYRRLRAALPDRLRIAYAVKSNPHRELLAALAGMGASFDCASEGELRRVMELGLPAGRVFFAGPGKRAAELRLALDAGARVQAEGWEDLERLDALASVPLVVNLRIHPIGGVEEDRHILGGVGPSAFGIDEEDLDEILERARGLDRVRIRGVHVFAATNQRSVDKLLATYAMVFGIARRVADAIGENSLEQIDLGGGLGVAYGPEQPGLDIFALGDGLTEFLAANPWFGGEVILEPGRLLSAPCGVYLARVVRIKQSRGVTFAILEGGINHLMRPFLTGEAFPVRAVGKSPQPRSDNQRGAEVMTASVPRDPGTGEEIDTHPRGRASKTDTVPYTLAGPLCTSLDRLGDVDLPGLAAGDLLAFGTAGGYGFTEGMTHFLSHPVPPEIWVE
jgi:diaminopimelate decarboxylase